MGSKNLKGVVARGTQKVEVADPEAVKEFSQFMRDNWREFSEAMRDYGTSNGLPDLQAEGALPTRNFQDGQFEGADKISGEAMANTILIDRGSCYGCPVRCKRVVKVDDDEYTVDPIYGGPEYETIGAFGSNCGVDDLRAVAAANELCNAYGVDTISAGMAVSFAMECYENGLLTKEDTDGLDLHFGNAKAMVELTRKICEREGLGDLLAEGPKRAVDEIGPESEKYNISVKGQPLPMHEGRTRHGQALGYAVSPTGADHMHNMWDQSLDEREVKPDLKLLGIYEPMQREVLNSQKVRAYTYISNWTWIKNHLGLCMFIGWKNDQIRDIVSAITGWKVSIWELMKHGERGITMSRLFNYREGFTRKDDRLPDRLAELHRTTSLDEKPVTPESLQEALTLYYHMTGGEPESGAPTAAKLMELDIEWLIHSSG
jgi:aldehyde:ferredoxin oxidoreductase